MKRRSIILAIALVYVPIFARLARNLALTVREEAYIQAARLMGQSTPRILGREIDEPDRLDRGQLRLRHDAVLRHRGACRVG